MEEENKIEQTNTEEMSSEKESEKKKKKIVFAKNKSEAVWAFIVLGLFIANTIYMLVEYFIRNKVS